MKMFLIGLKSKLAVAGGILLAGLLTALKYFKWKAKVEGERADIAEASVERVKVTQEEERDIDVQTASRRVDALKEIEQGEVPENIREPNKW